jgi:gliding motility-associated-like protein
MVTQAGTYSATLTNSICSVSDSKRVEVDYCDFEFALPNVFSPNEDGKNDVFKPVIIENISSLKIDIYNRWGTLVYSTTETTVDWLGFSLSGEPVADGVYFWTVDFTDYEGNPHRQNGIVTIFR